MQLNGAQATISQLESTTKLFTKDEILWAQNRNEKKVKEAKEAEERQEQEKARARQKAAAEGYRAEQNKPVYRKKGSKLLRRN